MNIYVGEDSVFLNATLPSPNKLRSYLVLRDGIGNAVGLIVDPTLSADDIEGLLGLNVETIFIEPENPMADVAARICGL